MILGTILPATAQKEDLTALLVAGVNHPSSQSSSQLDHPLTSGTQLQQGASRVSFLYKPGAETGMLSVSRCQLVH